MPCARLAAELDVTRATAEADLTHLAQQCLDAVDLPLDDVRAEVEQMEAAGDVEPDVRRHSRRRGARSRRR